MIVSTVASLSNPWCASYLNILCDLIEMKRHVWILCYCFSGEQSFSSVVRILPRHLRDLMQTNEMSAVYKKLAGMTGLEANIAFLNILREWPLYGATMFDVSQSALTSLPAKLWLAVSQLGIHLMEQRGQVRNSKFLCVMCNLGSVGMNQTFVS